MKLISMTDYVLEQTKLLLNGGQDNFSQVLIKTKISDSAINYANFLKLHLTLGMFIPTDENGNVLEEPKHISETEFKMFEDGGLYASYVRKLEQFQQAKDRVIFEGFCYFEHQSDFVNSRNNIFEYCVFNYASPKYGICTYEKNKGFHTYFQLMTIEDLVTIKKGITITETAVKKYGL